MTQVLAPDRRLPDSMHALIAEVEARLEHRPKLARMFARCFPHTWLTSVAPLTDGTAFVITGDIPAMWLRDSAAQVRPYLALAADPPVAALLAGVVRRQMEYILHDPYANAFNRAPDGRGHQQDLTRMSPLVWERKYETDSLCYPIQLAYLLWRTTGSAAHLDDPFRLAARRIVELWRTEQDHEARSHYRFQRRGLTAQLRDTLVRDGLGRPVAATGLTWSGFRPSDDACTYGYLIPSNTFAVVALRHLEEIAAVVHDEWLLREARTLGAEIEAGIRRFGTARHPRHGAIYAYEVDGYGNQLLMDDANVPSLLSLPYLGYCSATDPLYRATRAFALSSANRYFYRGARAEGIGSPHTPPRCIWPLAVIMRGLTALDRAEQEQALAMLERTDAGTEVMHESFFVDHPAWFTRPWFGWANALFSELVLRYCGLHTSPAELSG